MGLAMLELWEETERSQQRPLGELNTENNPLDLGEGVGELVDVDGDELVGVLDPVVQISQSVEGRVLEVHLVHLLREASAVCDGCRGRKGSAQSDGGSNEVRLTQLALHVGEHRVGVRCWYSDRLTNRKTSAFGAPLLDPRRRLPSTGRSSTGILSAWPAQAPRQSDRPGKRRKAREGCEGRGRGNGS